MSVFLSRPQLDSIRHSRKSSQLTPANSSPFSLYLVNLSAASHSVTLSPFPTNLSSSSAIHLTQASPSRSYARRKPAISVGFLMAWAARIGLGTVRGVKCDC